ncbi:porin family protein [Spirosoma endbachense]|uniref:Outer membrane beta-barrel protein n=1 Tax=Spirosoma endbachense TaxID=2666025 RepID=A0A6P1VZR0_9BACT|nr:porin family protein [Spirosoma endbachense]QHV97260.1 outer membrane beta-barrel protein [Spirosoma endbachense]
MKKISSGLVLLLFFSSLATMAQTEKGRWTIGAQVGNFQYSTQNEYYSFSGSLSPYAGYFVAKNLTIGAGIPLSLATHKYYDYHSNNTGIGISPNVRYYFGNANLKPYAGLQYSYSRTHQRTRTGSQDTDANGFASSFSPSIGLAYFLNHTVALNIGLNYIWQRYNSGNQNYDVDGKPVDSQTATSKYAMVAIGFDLFFGK